MVALDPYDMGRFALLRIPGVPEQGPRTAGASRGRDPRFDGVILGNSHLQLVSPAELFATTGVQFLSLTVPATGPKEQFVLLDYFLAHRARPARAIVIGVDPYWCTPDPAFANWQPFPFFLYDPSPWRYLAGLVSDETFDAAQRRVLYAVGLGRRGRARPDGYWNYEDHRVWRADVNGPALARTEPWALANTTRRFPQIERLSRRLASLDTPVVLVRPPAYVTSLPRPGTPLAEADAACGEALRRLAEGRPRTALVDWRIDRPENRDAANYLDGTHYRASIARALEREIAAALRSVGVGQP